MPRSQNFAQCANALTDMLARGQPIWLEVDGGIKPDNIAEVAKAGADTFVAGSAIFGSRDADGGYRGVVAGLRRSLAES